MVIIGTIYLPKCSKNLSLVLSQAMMLSNPMNLPRKCVLKKTMRIISKSMSQEICAAKALANLADTAL